MPAAHRQQPRGRRAAPQSRRQCRSFGRRRHAPCRGRPREQFLRQWHVRDFRHPWAHQRLGRVQGYEFDPERERFVESHREGHPRYQGFRRLVIHDLGLHAYRVRSLHTVERTSSDAAGAAGLSAAEVTIGGKHVKSQRATGATSPWASYEHDTCSIRWAVDPDPGRGPDY